MNGHALGTTMEMRHTPAGVYSTNTVHQVTIWHCPDHVPKIGDKRENNDWNSNWSRRGNTGLVRIDVLKKTTQRPKSVENG